MDVSKFKSIKKGAGKKVAEIFNRNRKKQPSDELTKIISEVGRTENENEQSKKNDDRAAKPPEV